MYRIENICYASASFKYESTFYFNKLYILIFHICLQFNKSINLYSIFLLFFSLFSENQNIIYLLLHILTGDIA